MTYCDSHERVQSDPDRVFPLHSPMATPDGRLLGISLHGLADNSQEPKGSLQFPALQVTERLPFAVYPVEQSSKQEVPD